MTRNDKLLRLAALCRQDHTAALVVVGWWAATAPDSDVDGVLGLLEEQGLRFTADQHLAAYRERWGRTPTPR